MASRLAGCFAIAALCVLLGGCSTTRSVQQTVSGWFGAGDAGEQRATALYSAAAGVALHESADTSSAIVGKLGLYEGVLRTRIENDFAFVRSPKSGRSGWVREAQLVERPPVARKAPVEAPSAAPEAAGSPAEVGTPGVADEAIEPAEPGEPPAETPERSIFDPY